MTAARRRTTRAWAKAWEAARAAGPEAVQALKDEVAFAKAKNVRRSLDEAAAHLAKLTTCEDCGEPTNSTRRKRCPVCAGWRRA